MDSEDLKCVLYIVGICDKLSYDAQSAIECSFNTLDEAIDLLRVMVKQGHVCQIYWKPE